MYSSKFLSLVMANCAKASLTSISSRLSSSKAGLLVGIYQNKGSTELTPAAASLDQASSGRLLTLLEYGGPLKAGQSRVLYGAAPQHPVVCAVGLTRGAPGPCPREMRDEAREAIRTAVAAGYRSLSEVGVSSAIVDACGDAEAAAEGAVLASFLYQTFKTEKKDRPDIVPHSETDRDAWKRGVALAEAQNLARELMETPANHLTPTIFAQRAKDVLEPLGVSVTPHDATWAGEHRMGAFLSVTRGSAEPPVFLELNYEGAEQGQQHLALVGKGVTFDAGGISLKPSKGMEAMRADMGGAACVVGALHAIATLKLPLNVKAYVPLCENLPSGTATKPGDVITAANGKTIQVDNTDAEGRLILADALHFACLDKPRALVDMATLTGAMSVALGGGAAGAFSSSDELWHAMQAAGVATGDRVWRMPLWQVYSKQVTEHGMADVHNLGKYEREAGSCTAASFLQQFVTCEHWMHLDIAGVMENRDEVPYLSKGMSGRPTRTIVQFAHLIASGQTQL